MSDYHDIKEVKEQAPTVIDKQPLSCQDKLIITIPSSSSDQEVYVIHSQGYTRDWTYKNLRRRPDETDEFCGICRELFTQQTRVTVLGCRHIFHAECQKDWGKQCPVCRKRSRRRPSN